MKYIKLDERLRELRAEHGFKQTDIANILGVTKQSVANWENGNIMPSIEMLVKLATYFSVSTDYLLGIEDRRCIEVEGLTDNQIAHIQRIADDFAELKAASA